MSAPKVSQAAVDLAWRAYTVRTVALATEIDAAKALAEAAAFYNDIVEQSQKRAFATASGSLFLTPFVLPAAVVGLALAMKPYLTSVEYRFRYDRIKEAVGATGALSDHALKLSIASMAHAADASQTNTLSGR